MIRSVRLLLPLVLGSVLALEASLPGQGTAPEAAPDLAKLRRLFQEANGFYLKKEYQRSIDTFRAVLELLPAQEDYDQIRMQVHYSMAAGCSRLGNEREAFLNLEKAIDDGLPENVFLMLVERNDDFAALRGSAAYAEFSQRMRVKLREREALAQRRKLEKLKGIDFNLESFDGKPLRKKDFLGQVLIVDIWGTWCGPCRMEIPHLIELHRRYFEKGLRIVGLNQEQTRSQSEAARMAKQYIREVKIPYPCALVTDEVVRSIPDFRGLPTTIFFGRDGLPRTMEVGYRDLAGLEAIVKPLLDEKAPGPPGAPGAPADPPAPKTSGTELDPARIESTEVSGDFFQAGQYYLAGQPTRKGFEDLKARGVKTVINLRSPGEQKDFDQKGLLETLGMKYFHIPVTHAALTDAKAEEFLRTLKEAEKPVLIHCASGNRAGAFWAIHLGVNHGLPPEGAIALAEKSGLKSSDLKDFVRNFLSRRRT